MSNLNPYNFIVEGVGVGALVGAGVGAAMMAPFAIRGLRICNKLKKGILAAQTPEECAKNIDDVFNSSWFHEFTHECEKIVKGEIGTSSQIGTTQEGAIYTMMSTRQRFAQLIRQSGEDWKRSCLKYNKKLKIVWCLAFGLTAASTALHGAAVGSMPRSVW